MSAQTAQPVYGGELPEGLQKISNIIAVSSCKVSLCNFMHIKQISPFLSLKKYIFFPGRSWKIYCCCKSSLYTSRNGSQGWNLWCWCLRSKLTNYGFSWKPVASDGKPPGWTPMLAWNLVLALIMVNRLTFRTQKAEVSFRLSIWASKWCLLDLLDKEEQSCEVQWFQESLISCWPLLIGRKTCNAVINYLCKGIVTCT